MYWYPLVFFQFLKWGVEYCGTKNVFILGVYGRMCVVEKLDNWSMQSWVLWSLL